MQKQEINTPVQAADGSSTAAITRKLRWSSMSTWRFWQLKRLRNSRKKQKNPAITVPILQAPATAAEPAAEEPEDVQDHEGDGNEDEAGRDEANQEEHGEKNADEHNN